MRAGTPQEHFSLTSAARPTPDNMGASRISASGSNLTAPLNYCAIAALLGALAALLAGHVWQSQRTAASLDVAALRRAIVAGEPLPPSLRQFAERAVSASHAPTELALRLGLESTDRHQTALSLVLVAAAFDGTPVQHELAHVLRSFDPSHSAEAYLARQYGEGLAQRVRGGLPPRSDPPLPIGGWIGAELSSGQSDRVRVLSRRPPVAVVDHFVDDDAVSAAAAGSRRRRQSRTRRRRPRPEAGPRTRQTGEESRRHRSPKETSSRQVDQSLRKSQPSRSSRDHRPRKSRPAAAERSTRKPRVRRARSRHTRAQSSARAAPHPTTSACRGAPRRQ